MSESSLSEYMKNANTTMDSSNYNEIDGLVFAELSYFKFEDAYSSYTSENVSVPSFAKTILKSTKVTTEERNFLNQIMCSPRYKDCTISNMAAENEESQWAAMTIHMNDDNNSSIIAMRGTDGTKLGWQEDFQLLYDNDGTRAQELSADYLRNSDAQNIYMVGHSKGGNDVTSAYVMSDKSVRDKVISVYNYDGPGTNNDFKNMYKEGYKELDDKLSNYYPEDSVIGQLLNDNPGKNIYIDTTPRGNNKNLPILGEHDPFQWNVKNSDSFEEMKQSDFSQDLNRVLDRTVDSMSQKERAQLYKALEKLGTSDLIGDQKIIGGIKLSYGLFELSNTYLSVPQLVPQKLALYHMLVMLVLNTRIVTLENDMENSIQAVRNIWNKVDMAADWFENKIRKTSEKLRRVKADFEKYVKDNWNDIKSWIDKKRKQTASYYDIEKNVHIDVDSKVLLNGAQSMLGIEKDLADIRGDMETVRRSLSLYAKSINTYRMVRIMSHISQQQRNCKSLAKAAEQVVQLYDKCENKVIDNTFCLKI